MTLVDEKNLLKCPFSNDKNFEKLFEFKKFPIFMGVVEKSFKPEYKNMVFNINKKTGTVQIYPRVPLKKLYFRSHGSGTVGTTWKKHHKAFFNFVKPSFKNIVIEIGGGHNSISKNLKNKDLNSRTKLITFDPNGKKIHKNHKLIKDFFHHKLLKGYINRADLVVHSHLFEHIFEPVNFLKLINKILNNDGKHIFSIPNLKKMISMNQSNAMNFEHPYFLEESLVDKLLLNNGFKIVRKLYFKNHSIFYETIKKPKYKNLNYNKYSFNKRLFLNFYSRITKDIKKIKVIRKNINNQIFLFGAHIFSQMIIFGNKVNTKKFDGVIDNDKNKQGKYLYGTKLKVHSLSIIKKLKEPYIVLRAGSYNDEIKKQIFQINKKTKII